MHFSDVFLLDDDATLKSNKKRREEKAAAATACVRTDGKTLEIIAFVEETLADFKQISVRRLFERRLNANNTRAWRFIKSRRLVWPIYAKVSRFSKFLRATEMRGSRRREGEDKRDGEAKRETGQDG